MDEATEIVLLNKTNSPVLTVCKTNALETVHWQTT